MAKLSEREAQVVALVADGLTNKQIGKQLHLSPLTVKTHLHNVRERIDAREGVNARVVIVMWALRNGAIT